MIPLSAVDDVLKYRMWVGERDEVLPEPVMIEKCVFKDSTGYNLYEGDLIECEEIFKEDYGLGIRHTLASFQARIIFCIKRGAYVYQRIDKPYITGYLSELVSIKLI